MIYSAIFRINFVVLLPFEKKKKTFGPVAPCDKCKQFFVFIFFLMSLPDL